MEIDTRKLWRQSFKQQNVCLSYMSSGKLS